MVQVPPLPYRDKVPPLPFLFSDTPIAFLVFATPFSVFGFQIAFLVFVFGFSGPSPGGCRGRSLGYIVFLPNFRGLGRMIMLW